MPEVLLTGGNGRLGKELQKYIKCYAPTSKEFDITAPTDLNENFQTVIHAAAYTDVTGAETDREGCFRVNVTGTDNMVKMFPHAYFVYISTEYVIHPVNFYSYTKLWGEEIVRKHSNYLIIRTLFKANPFPYDAAFVDQYTTGDYVDVIAPLIAKEILMRRIGTVLVGTGRKSIFQLARRTRPDIKGISVTDVAGVRLPHDYLT